MAGTPDDAVAPDTAALDLERCAVDLAKAVLVSSSNMRTRDWMITAAAVLALGAPLLATGAPASPRTAMTLDPCPPPKAAADVGTLLVPGARFVRPEPPPRDQQPSGRAAATQRGQDWADLCRYRSANAALTRAPRLVLMGDSITDFWRQGEPALFASGAIVDRGISGQTSPQMLVRFWPDVIALHPRMVQILAGTNDIAGNTGATTAQDFKNNIMAMVALARAHHMRVLLGSIPPAVSFWWAPQYRPAQEIRRLNGWLRHYAQVNGLVFVDYYARLATPGGAFRRDLSNDGVHPNEAGYKVMTELLKSRIGAE